MVIEMAIRVSTSYGYPNLFSVKLTNTQNVDTPSPFQQMLQLSISQLQGYIPILASDFHNIRFVYNGAAIPAWLESISNGVATIWVNIPVSIPANSSISIDMEINPSLNFDGNYWGEAPQLSSIYGVYDNGANVFDNYWNFAGSTLPTGFTSVVGSGGSVTVNNGLTITLSGVGWGTYVISTSTYASGNVLDAYFSQSGSPASYSSNASLIWTGSSSGATASYSIGWVSPTTSSPVQLETCTNYIQGGSGGTNFVGITEPFNNNNNVISLYINSAGNLGNSWYNYASLSASSTAQVISNGYIMFQTTYYSQFVQWLRVRAYPPNGVMPSVEVIRL